MSDEVKRSIEKWAEAVNSNFEVFHEIAFRNFEETEPDDTFGWGRFISLHMKDIKSHKTRGFLLTGPNGCGKHQAMNFAVKELADIGYSFWFLSGLDFDFDDPALIEKAFDHLIDNYSASEESADTDENTSGRKCVCIIIENPSECRYPSQLMNVLAKIIYFSKIADDFIMPFVIIISEEDKFISMRLRNELMTCHMTRPDRKKRLSYIERHTMGRPDYVEKLADVTDGFTYSELRDTVEQLDTLNRDSEVTDIELGQCAVIDFPRDPKNIFTERLLEKLDDVIEQFPKILSGVQANNANKTNSLSLDDSLVSREDRKEALLEKYEKQTGAELVVEWYGAEKAAQLEYLHK